MALRNEQSGVTLIELLVAIAVIGIMTGIFVMQVSVSDNEQVEVITEKVASDVRQIRNLAASRVIGEDNQYPTGGYGMYFQDRNVTDPAYYVVFADDGQNIGYQSDEDSSMAKYIFPDQNVTVYPSDLPDTNTFYFTFIREHVATTSVPAYGGNEALSLVIKDINADYNGNISIFDVFPDAKQIA